MRQHTAHRCHVSRCHPSSHNITMLNCSAASGGRGGCGRGGRRAQLGNPHHLRCSATPTFSRAIPVALPASSRRALAALRPPPCAS